MLVSSLMADYANSSSKLSIASRASQCYGSCWWLALHSLRFFFTFTDSLFFHIELLLC